MWKLIDPKDRKKYCCHFCGTNLSVKYLVEVYDPVISNKRTFVCACNKCVTFYRLLDDLVFKEGMEWKPVKPL